jgi:hypothetical protein
MCSVFDWREFMRYKVMLFLLWIMNVADYLLTCRALASGYEEANAIAAWLISHDLFAVYKLLLVPLGLLFLARVNVRGFAYRLLQVTFASYAGLMVYFVVAVR